jgi:hypothetical protein
LNATVTEVGTAAHFWRKTWKPYGYESKRPCIIKRERMKKYSFSESNYNKIHHFLSLIFGAIDDLTW